MTMKTKETFRSWFADLMLIGVFVLSLVGIEKIASSDLDRTLMQGFALVLFLVFLLGWVNNSTVHEE